MIKISAPGKICIAGEWAVLETGNPLIVAALEKRVFVKIKKSKDKYIHITLRDFGIKNLKAYFQEGELRFKERLTKKEKKYVSFVRRAIETVLNYLEITQPFEIETWGGETIIKKRGKTESIGFGSSAAVTVAVIAGLFRFYGKKIEKKISEKIFKLAAISHFFVQGKIGSGFDVAASTFGGVLVYKRFSSKWLINRIKKRVRLKKIIEMKWPGFYIERLKTPRDFHLLVGWTGKSSSTAEMVKKLNKWKVKNQKEYKQIIKKINNLVRDLLKHWKKNNKEKILKLIRENEYYLRELGEKSNVNIETPTLRKLSEIANRNRGAGKLSGAGGGDCGIAIVFNKQDAERIKKEWQKNGVYFINTQLSLEGVREEIKI